MKIGLASATIALALSFCCVISGCKKDESSEPTQPQPSGPTFTWQATGLSGGTVRALVVNNVGNVFASVDGDGVYRTTDNGSTWSKTLNGPFQSSVGSGYADCFCADGNTLWAGTDGAGVLRSTDGGVTWIEMNTGQTTVGSVRAMCAARGTVYCGAENGVFELRQESGWTQVETVPIYAVCTLGNYIFAGGAYHPSRPYGVVVVNEYNGDPWYRTIVSRYQVSALAIGSSQNRLFAGTLDGVLRTTGRWYTWESINPYMSADAMAVTPSGQIFVGGYLGSTGVERSTNEGESWTRMTDGLTNERVHELAVNPAGFIFAGTEAGVFRGRL